MSENKQSVTSLLGEFKSLAILVFILVLCFGSGFLLSNCQSGNKYDSLLTNYTNVSDRLTVTKNRVQSLDKTLRGKNEEAQELRNIIASFEDRPAEIRYIVKTETIIEGSTEVVVELPPNYLYRLDNGLAVASFSQSVGEGNGNDHQYEFTAFDLTFNTNVVISEDETAVMLAATSSHEPEQAYNMPVQSVDVTKIREHKIFEPHLIVGMTVPIEFAPPGIDATASFAVSLFHPVEEVDLLAPRISFNNKQFRIGIDAIGYNLGHKIPIITDLWVSVGTSIAIGDQYPSLDVTIGSKF